MSGIYIHIPFCKQACHYCNFHFSTSLKKKEEMIDALISEVEMRKNDFKNVTVETIYFGGGTPSLLSSEEIKKIIDSVYKNYKVSDTPEITLEANPDDLTNSRIIEISKSPVNRLSIGIQSFLEKDLKLMNRAHNTSEAHSCLEEAVKHFDNISLDLIYGIPGTTSQEWIENIDTALSFGVKHISSYALVVEPKTALKSFIDKGVIKNTPDELVEEQFHILVEKLEANNYEHYELSSFGKAGYFSRNNTAYWQGKHYIGIGPSAHSFNGKQRGWNVENNTKYIKAIQNNELPIEMETLSLNDQYNEYIMISLRMAWGVSIKKVREDFGITFESYLLKHSQKHINEHLLYIEDETLKVTKNSKFLSDGIASDLFKIDL
ncbi:radical SAM family heme chaperone HemW [Lacinutrix mariniflava]|uniref:radical SAM family heme chaperone HemW n=1 Tax=Lacinutrix mariniflava TaxID=342955 RepID=UPI0006E20005|nr:radical SAM family heme chaperone HemW [Lacinutrix mariniflava]